MLRRRPRRGALAQLHREVILQQFLALVSDFLPTILVSDGLHDVKLQALRDLGRLLLLQEVLQFEKLVELRIRLCLYELGLQRREVQVMRHRLHDLLILKYGYVALLHCLHLPEVCGR